MFRERMGGLDTAYLSAELPGNPLHVMAILMLDARSMPGGYSFEKLREFMRQRLHQVPPLRHTLVEVPFGLDRPRWSTVEEVDLKFHMRRSAVPSPGGARELSDIAAEFCERPLDRSRPLWEIVVVEGLASGEIALIAKLHHAMMDGIAGLRHMAALLGSDDVAGGHGVEAPETGQAARASSALGDIRLLAEAVPESFLRPFRVGMTAGRTLLALSADAVSRALSNGGFAAQAEEEPARAVPQSLFNKRSSPRRDVAYLSVPLSTVKAVGRAFDATVNDVVLAMVGGSARRHLDERGRLPKESLVAAIPASTHVEGDDLANAFTVLFPTLATDVEAPGERLRAIVETSRRVKAVARPGVAPDLLRAWIDITPPWLYQLLARTYVGWHVTERMESPFFNLLVSSVPGPTAPLAFAGARIMGIHPLGPIYDGMLLNITALGREHSVDIGLVACHEGVPGVWEIADGLEAALIELEEAARIP